MQPAYPPRLNSHQSKQLERLVHQFEEAQRSSTAVNLNTFLPGGDVPLRLAVLEELIKRQLQHSWRQGQPAYLEKFVTQFAELRSSQTLLPALLLEEYQLRRQHGDRPDLDSYRQRFPEQFDRLQQLAQSTVGEDRSSILDPRSATPGKGGSLPVLGGYKVIEWLGKGKWGQVWKAEAPDGLAAAVKMIRWPPNYPSTRRELTSLELIQVKDLRHPFLLPVHTFLERDDHLLIVMALAEGSLRDRWDECRQRGRHGLPPAELLRHFHEAAEALDYLHSQGLQHRNLKPENLLLSQGHVQVADLGLARLVASARDTPPYLAPELLDGKACPSSDQYSLALVYLELRRGQCPFSKASCHGLLLEDLQDGPGLEPLTEGERQVLLQAGARGPAQRFPSCKAFAEALEQALVPGQAFGYRKIKRIGKGAFGEVWQGEAPGGIPVAIKVIDFADLVRARSELAALELIKGLSHPYLLTNHAFWLKEEELHIAMELADGSLRDRLRECRQDGRAGIPAEELLAYMEQTAAALDHLHEQRIFHRDVKPENILLCKGYAKVADFGVARMLADRPLFSATTSGTLPYLPPELWCGKGSLHSDQYSLAITYVELRLGRPPFQTKCPVSAREAHLHQEPDLTPLAGPEQAVLRQALAKNPDQRFPSCRAFVAALTEAARQPVEPPPAQTFTLSGTMCGLMAGAAMPDLLAEVTSAPPTAPRRDRLPAVLLIVAACLSAGALLVKLLWP